MKKLIFSLIFLSVLGLNNTTSAQFCHICDTTLVSRRPFIELPLFFMPLNNFSIEVPNRNIMPKMNTNVSVGGSIAVFPFKNLPLGIELRGSLGGYAWGKENMTFTFDSISTTTLQVEYKSNMNKTMLGFKFVNLESRNFVKPFASVYAGYAFMRSRLYIPDPADEDDCQPLENKLVHKFNGFVYGGEAGLEFNMNKIRKNTNYKGVGWFLYVSAGMLRSHSNLEYINIRHRTDEINGPQPAHHYHHLHSEPGEFTAEFVNLSSNQYHTHKVAELYRTPMNMWNINCGFVLRF